MDLSKFIPKVGYYVIDVNYYNKNLAYSNYLTHFYFNLSDYKNVGYDSLNKIYYPKLNYKVYLKKYRVRPKFKYGVFQISIRDLGNSHNILIKRNTDILTEGFLMDESLGYGMTYIRHIAFLMGIPLTGIGPDFIYPNMELINIGRSKSFNNIDRVRFGY